MAYIDDEDKNKSYCPLPWMSLSSKPNGQLRICCHANTSASKGMHQDQSGKNYNISTSSLSEVRNSFLVKEVRQHMLENKRHPMCIRCNNEDDQGVRSRRKYEKENWFTSFNLKDAIRVTAEDGSIPGDLNLLHLDVRFGNLCNLKCRMCGPTDSSKWYEEFYDTVFHKFRDTIGTVELKKDENGVVFAVNDPFKWHQKEDFWQELEKQIPHIRQYYFAGGEPFLIDRHYDLLQKIVDLGYADQVVIEYNSNLSAIPNRAWNIWKHFRKVNIGVSVDGYGALNDYIRYPSKWANLEKNLDQLDNAEGNFDVWFASTIQIYNIVGVLDLIRWIYEKKFKRVGQQEILPFITPHPLHNPPYFNIRSLPPEVKKYATERYQAFFTEMTAKDERFKITKKIFDGYLNYMNSADWTENLSEFLNKTKTMDDYRKQSYESVSPDIAPMIYSYQKNHEVPKDL